MLGNLYIVSAPSGAGKTSLVTRLTKEDLLVRVSLSSTTRDKRPGEEQGVSYDFVTLDEFKKLIAQDVFLEHAEVFENFYGTRKDLVEQQLQNGQDVILEIDWQGAQQIRKLYPQAYSIFIVPPSLKELERRLTGRGTDSQEIIDGRMKQARSEMEHYPEFDYVIINNEFEAAFAQLHSIFIANRLKVAQQEGRYAKLFKSLLD